MPRSRCSRPASGRAAADLLAEAVTLDPPSSHRTHLDLLLAWLHLWRDELDLADEVLAEHREMAHRRGRAADAAVRGADGLDRRRVRGDDRTARAAAGPTSRRSPTSGSSSTRTGAGTSWPWVRRRQPVSTHATGGDRAAFVRELTGGLAEVAMAPVWRALAEAELEDSREGWEAHARAVPRYVVPGPPGALRRAPAGRAPVRGSMTGRPCVPCSPRHSPRAASSVPGSSPTGCQPSAGGPGSRGRRAEGRGRAAGGADPP